MPRIIEERWRGIGYDVHTEEAPLADDNGNIIHDGHGQPKTQTITVLDLIVPMLDGQRLVHIPFTPEAKKTLLAKLTGGIVVPNGSSPVV